DSLNSNVRVTDLLRKALVVARKLNVRDFEEWINSELTGYKDTDKVPEYRRLEGVPVAYSHYHGWYRLMTYNLAPEDAERMTTFWFHQPISYFESSLNEDTESITVSYNIEAERMLTRALHNR